MSTIASSNILLVLNNMDNLITENYIENEFLGIFLVTTLILLALMNFAKLLKIFQSLKTPITMYLIIQNIL